MKAHAAAILVFAGFASAQPQPRPSGPLQLSLKQAVDIALAPEGNARLRIAEQAVRQAEARSAQARAALLPDLSSSLAYQNQTRNLAAFGIQVNIPIPGFQFPEVVGPFSTLDVRASVVQNIFDFSSVRRYQASRAGIQAARAENEDAEEQTADQVARLYLAALRAGAGLETARANVALAEALADLAENRKTAGTGTGIDVTRAQVQLANERQRLLVAGNERDRAHLQLLKAMGLRLDTPLVLTDRLAYAPVDRVEIEEAVKVALKSRADFQAQREREESARLSYSAARFERLPTLAGFADYGSIGTGFGNAAPTRTYGVQLRLPLFDGGRRDARRGEAAAAWRQERVRTGDLRDQIELSIRLARDSLESAEEQVQVANEGLKLADNELAQARRRFEAGVTSSIEVTDAQTRLARARENQISALFNYNLARLELAQSMGVLRQTIQ